MTGTVAGAAPDVRDTSWPAVVALTPRVLSRTLPWFCLPAVLDPGVMGRLDALRQLPGPASTAVQALQLYLWAPVVAVSATVLFLLPGLVLAFPRHRELDVGDWLTRAAALAIVSLALVVGAAQALGASPTGRTFALVVLAVAAAAMGWKARAWHGPKDAAGRVTADTPFLAALLLVPAALFALLSAKFFWESLNGDGAHAFESARLLLRQPVPFWPASAGPIASFPGTTSFLFALPSSWYLRLFGALDVAARLPFLMHLGLLAGAVGAFVPAARRGDVRPVLIWLGLLPYVAAMAYSATYNPYSADLALPATQDTLLMVFVLGAVLAWSRGETPWFALLAALSIASLPNGFILMGLVPAAAIVARRPRPWRAAWTAVAILVACLVVATAAPALLRLAGLPAPGDEYGVAGLLRYFAFLQVGDWERVLYVAIPCGLVPVVTAFRWRRLDGLSRTMVLMAAAYFLFFYVQAYTALHHYVPSMLLLLAAHWRAISLVDAAALRRWRAWTAAGAVVALALSMPRVAAPHRDGEFVGRAIVVRLGDYAVSDPAVFRASTLLGALFPFDWAPEVPEQYGGSPLVWNRYARHDGTVDGGTNYVLQDAAAAPPEGMREVARGEGAVLYVLSDSAWQADRARRPPPATGSGWLTVPRGVLFRTEPRGDAARVLDVAALLERAGVDVDALLDRLGVSR